MSLPLLSASRGNPVPSPQCLQFLRHLAYDRPYHRQTGNKTRATAEGIRGYRSCYARYTEVSERSTSQRTDCHTPRLSRLEPRGEIRNGLNRTGSFTRAHGSCHRTPDTIAGASEPRRYSTAVAEAVQMTITDEELESVLDYREDVASPPPLQQEHPFRKRGRTFARDQRGIDRVMERIETQVEEKTTLRTTKQNYLITRHLVRNRGPYAHPVWTMNDKTAQLVSDFTELLRRPRPDYDQIWKAYIALPQPRVVYFSGQVLVDFLALLRRVKVKHKDVVSRYLTVMEDMSQSDCRLSPRDLNSAIHWIGRTKDVDPGESLEKAVEMFQKYEDGFMKGDLVTFNTLGYLALKAKRNGMVRTILETVAERQLQNDRYTYMLKIAYYGKMKNVQGVKKEYKNMIAAGELIDTIALNAVIRALLDAGDVFMAEKTLERMKEIHVTKTQKPYAPEDWIGQRKLGHVLKYSAWQLRHHHDLRAEMQDLTPITPNSHTYRILIEHHAKVTGNLDRMVDLLGEALERNFPIQFGTWRDIFDGFEKHRHIRFSSWTASNLRKLHELFSNEVKSAATRGKNAAPSQDGEGRPRKDSTAIASLISAYVLCTTRAEASEILTQIRDEWDVDEKASAMLDRILKSQDTAIQDRGRPRADGRVPGAHHKKHSGRRASVRYAGPRHRPGKDLSADGPVSF